MNSDYPQLTMDSSWGPLTFKVIHKAPFRNILQITRKDSIVLYPNSQFNLIKTEISHDSGKFNSCHTTFYSTHKTQHTVYTSTSSYEDCQRVSDFLQTHFL
jgi:hypothetical protein